MTHILDTGRNTIQSFTFNRVGEDGSEGLLVINCYLPMSEEEKEAIEVML